MINEQVERINSYLKTQLWMDFELCQMSFLKVVLSGRIDEIGEEKILITFEYPHVVSCVFMFTFECEGDFISIVEGDEAYKINVQYGVTQGNYIFKILNTNIGSDMYIVAKDIKVEIFDK